MTALEQPVFQSMKIRMMQLMQRILRSEFKKIWIKRTELTNEV